MKKLLVTILFAAVALAFENVDAKTFAKLMQQKDVVLLDVRTPSEFMEGHIEGANLVPIQLFSYLYLGGKGLQEKKVLVYCRSGNRSVTAAKALERWGVKSIYNLKHGILEWKSAGFSLVK